MAWVKCFSLFCSSKGATDTWSGSCCVVLPDGEGQDRGAERPCAETVWCA